MTQVSKNIWKNNPLLIPVIHLPPLLGHAGFDGMGALIDYVTSEVDKVEQAGLPGVLLENEGDPLLWEQPLGSLSSFSILAHEIRKTFPQLLLGVEVLLHHPEASLAIAGAAGLDFIRVDYFVDEMKREDLGIVSPRADSIVQWKKTYCDQVRLFTDIQVKHASMVDLQKEISLSAKEAFLAGSDGVVISGSKTGTAVDLADLESLKSFAVDGIWIGSGLNANNIHDYLPFIQGAFVGTSLQDSNKRLSAIKLSELVTQLEN